MIRVRLNEPLRRAPGGKCEFNDHCIASTSYGGYALDNWFYYIEHLAFRLTAEKEILDIGGYLPCHNWTVDPELTVPKPTLELGIVLDEPFDPSGRDGGQDFDFPVTCNPESRTVALRFLDASTGEQFASPHSDFFVGISGDQRELACVILANVEGVTPKLFSHGWVRSILRWRG